MEIHSPGHNWATYCPICFKTHSVSNMVVTPCCHQRFCLSCIKKYKQVLVHERERSHVGELEEKEAVDDHVPCPTCRTPLLLAAEAIKEHKSAILLGITWLISKFTCCK